METTLLVLAAGAGSRFGGAKQIAAVGPAGESMLEYSVFDALRAGFSRIVFLVRREDAGEFGRGTLGRMRRHIEAGVPGNGDGGDPAGGARFLLAFQDVRDEVPADRAALAAGRHRPWGTGHALLCAGRAMRGTAGPDGSCPPFAVCNADDYYGPEAFSLVRDFLAREDRGRAAFCMAGYRLDGTLSPNGPVSRGVCDVDERGMLAGITEYLRISPGKAGKAGEGSGDPDGPTGFLSGAGEGRGGEGTAPGAVGFTGRETVSMNLWGFTGAVLDIAAEEFVRFLDSLPPPPDPAAGTREFFLPDIVDRLVRSGRANVRVLHTPSPSFGLTYREDLDLVRLNISRLTSGGLYPSPLWRRT